MNAWSFTIKLSICQVLKANTLQFGTSLKNKKPHVNILSGL